MVAQVCLGRRDVHYHNSDAWWGLHPRGFPPAWGFPVEFFLLHLSGNSTSQPDLYSLSPLFPFSQALAGTEGVESWGGPWLSLEPCLGASLLRDGLLRATQALGFVAVKVVWVSPCPCCSHGLLLTGYHGTSPA